MNLLFDSIGDGKEVTLSSVKKESNNVSSTGTNAIYDSFNSWKESVTTNAVKENFFMDYQKIKFAFALLGLIGIGLFLLDRWLLKTPLSFISLGISICFIIYILTFKKRTVKGNDDYNKWMGFKKFLNDFGRFDEKELPEIVLWEKYLVYATVFGIADKVSKTMKIKFSEINPEGDTFNPTFSNYYMMSSLSNNLTKTISTSVTNSYAAVQTYKSNNWSSGSGAGGGFSAGGGFGGGGGARGGGF